MERNRNWIEIVNSTEDVSISRSVEHFQTIFAILRTSQRCSADASTDERTVQVKLPAGFNIQVVFGDEHLSFRLSKPDESIAVTSYTVRTSDDEKVLFKHDCSGTEDSCYDLRGDEIAKINKKVHLSVVVEVKYERNRSLPEARARPRVGFGPDPELHEDMLRLYESQIGTDVVVAAGGTEFNAHKSVLIARSGYFAGSFDFDFDGTVNIEDVDGDAFRILLEFMYCGGLPNGIANRTNDIQFQLQLLLLADRLIVPAFVEYFSLDMIPRLGSDCLIALVPFYNSLIDVIRVTTQISGLEKLRKACVVIFRRRLAEFKYYEDLAPLKDLATLKEAPDVSRELNDLVVSEEKEFFMDVRAVTEDRFAEHQGTDLFDPERVEYVHIKVRPEATPRELLEVVAKTFKLSLDEVRVWPIRLRDNQTFRPSCLDFTLERVEALLDIKSSTPLTIFVETTPPGEWTPAVANHCIAPPPPSSTQGSTLASTNSVIQPTVSTITSRVQRPLPPFDKENDVLLFFKYFCPVTRSMRYVGHLCIPIDTNIQDIFPRLRQLAGLRPETPLLLFEEVKPKLVESIDRVEQTFNAGIEDLMDGDIYVFQRDYERLEDFLRTNDAWG